MPEANRGKPIILPPFPEYFRKVTERARRGDYSSGEMQRLSDNFGLTSTQVTVLRIVTQELGIFTYHTARTTSSQPSILLTQADIPSFVALAYLGGVDSLARVSPGGERIVTIGQLLPTAEVTIPKIRKILFGYPEILDQYPEIIKRILDPQPPANPDRTVELVSLQFDPDRILKRGMFKAEPVTYTLPANEPEEPLGSTVAAIRASVDLKYAEENFWKPGDPKPEDYDEIVNRKTE